MKILYVTQFFYPETAAPAFRAYENAREWVKMGHEVTVFTGYPNFPTGKLFDGYSIKMLQAERIEGINVLRSKTVIRPNTGKLSRSILYLSFLGFGLSNMVFNKNKIGRGYDIVLSTSGTVFAPIVGYYYAKTRKVPFILELRDITYRQILAVGGSKGSIGYKTIRWLELKLCKCAHKIITLTKGFKEDLINEGISSGKIEVIPNGVEVKDRNFPAAAKKCGEIVLSYFGTFGVSQGLVKVIGLLDSLKIGNRKVKIILIGDGAEKQKLLQHKEKEALTNTYILDSMPQEELEQYYEMSDFCIVILNNSPYFMNTIPSKLFQIMGRKKPVLFFGPKGEAASVVEEANAGIAVTGDDMEENIVFVGKYLSQLIDKGIYDKQIELYSKNGFKFVSENYDRIKLAKTYYQILGKVAKDGA